jgi:hypothetical protein
MAGKKKTKSLNCDKKQFPRMESAFRGTKGQLMAAQLPLPNFLYKDIPSRPVKLLPFQFSDPLEDLQAFYDMECQLASYFSEGWDWLNGSMTSNALREEESPNFDNAPWGLALFSLRYNPTHPQQPCFVKILPIVFHYGGGESLCDGEKWLTAYLAQGWELLANFMIAGIGDGELAANSWGISFMLLRHFDETSVTPNYPHFLCRGELCPQNVQCHACSY